MEAASATVGDGHGDFITCIRLAPRQVRQCTRALACARYLPLPCACLPSLPGSMRDMTKDGERLLPHEGARTLRSSLRGTPMYRLCTHRG